MHAHHFRDFLKRFPANLRREHFMEGAQKVLCERPKHVLSQSTTPFACTLQTHNRICTATGLRRSNGSQPQREGTMLGVFVPVWLVLPPREATNLGVFDLCHFDLLNGAVRFRVGVKLADFFSRTLTLRNFPVTPYS